MYVACLPRIAWCSEDEEGKINRDYGSVRAGIVPYTVNKFYESSWFRQTGSNSFLNFSDRNFLPNPFCESHAYQCCFIFLYIPVLQSTASSGRWVVPGHGGVVRNLTSSPVVLPPAHPRGVQHHIKFDLFVQRILHNLFLINIHHCTYSTYFQFSFFNFIILHPNHSGSFPHRMQPSNQCFR